MTLLVHSSLSSLGWVCGGAQTVVLALMDLLGDDGTLVMPTHTSDLSDPVFWVNPPVPTDWWPTIRETMPAFDERMTPTREMGQIVEVFRTMPKVRRSQHPQVSFAAIGKHSRAVTENHQFNFGLGDGSPLARVYELNGYVLLLGVGHDRNTSLHLAEHRTKPRVNKEIVNGAPVLQNGNREWITLQDIELHSGDFAEIGTQFSSRHSADCRVDNVGMATTHLLRQRPLVDFAEQWIAKYR